MYKRRILVSLLCISVLLFNSINCAYILDGAKEPHERTTEIQWAYVVMDIFLTGSIGLVIDFATGAIYKKVENTPCVLEDKIKMHLVELKMPVYVMRNDVFYAVTNSDTDGIVYTEISSDIFPQHVLEAIMNELQ
ncbi:hypothetical protein CHISP_0883 [Chitinispirillum alkaliphilum]|nr:hypothetical protein CHISP_0883 [Chitinispirillum alkaliphilum]